MTELAPQDDNWDIDRSKSPERIINLGGFAITLTYGNTTVYRFKQPWDMIDHAFVRHNEGRGGTYIFDSNQLLNDLTDEWYPTELAPYPPAGDLLAYRNWQSQVLEAELRNFGEES